MINGQNNPLYFHVPRSAKEIKNNAQNYNKFRQLARAKRHTAFVLAICETKHAKAKYWISIKTMKKMGKERKKKP